MALVLTSSCNEPETIVTNIIHTDGSVTRKLEMRNSENIFKISDLQVPFDSTWTVRDSIEINENRDTVWVRRAEKLFKGADEINNSYRTDNGYNKSLNRHAEFFRRFNWFNTEYTFVEIIDKKMNFGYPVREFLNNEELKWFYSPDNINSEKKNGPDSIFYRSFSDTVDMKLEKWYLKNLVSEWIGEFAKLTENRSANASLIDSLKKRENEFAQIVKDNLENFDSLWSEGTLLRNFIGESNSVKYKTEADSAANIAADHFWVTFKDYTMRMLMPGKLTGTNGITDSTGMAVWMVKSDYFLTEPFKMSAVSKISNRWAWWVSGIFLLFVITGVVMRRKGKG